MSKFSLAFAISILTFLSFNKTYGQLSPECIGGFDPITGRKCNNVITTAVPFLRIIPDARSAGMGDVGITLSPNANSLYHNVSNLGFAQKEYGVALSYTPWLKSLGISDIFIADLSAFKKLDELQSVSLGAKYFSLGEINYVNSQQQSQGTGRPREFALTGAYARKLSDVFSGGISLKYIYSRIAQGTFDGISDEIKPINTAAIDLSGTFNKDIKLGNTPAEWVSGIVLSNLGPKVSYISSSDGDFLPANLGLASGLVMHFDEVNDFTASLEFNKLLVPSPQEAGTANEEKSSVNALFSSFGDAPGGFSEELSEVTLGLGLEYTYDKQFSARAGYFNEAATKGNRKFFTLGLGVTYQVIGINFSYLIPTTPDQSPLDNTFRFSLVFDFDSANSVINGNDL